MKKPPATIRQLAERLENCTSSKTSDKQVVAGLEDPVSHPSHYTSHPSGVECIDITKHYSFCLGNAIKYIWRAGLKGPREQDLEKAIWYLKEEIATEAAKPNRCETSPPPSEPSSS